MLNVSSQPIYLNYPLLYIENLLHFAKRDIPLFIFCINENKTKKKDVQKVSLKAVANSSLLIVVTCCKLQNRETVWIVSESVSYLKEYSKKCVKILK